MRLLVTGSSGHLGEALVRTLRARGDEVVGLDIAASAQTDIVASITERARLRAVLGGVDAVLHAATLHKPHLVTHTKQQFVETNVTGTLTLLEECVRAGVAAVVFTSSTSAFGHALRPAPGEPAAWITEDVAVQPKNIYGITKVAAEGLCELFARQHGLGCIVLRTSRFFPDPDDNRETRQRYADANAKTNELLFRRVDLEDAVGAHLCALEAAPAIGFGRFIVSATTPFGRADTLELRRDACAVVARQFPEQPSVYARLGWTMFPTIDRVYVNEKARRVLGWQPRYDYRYGLERAAAGLVPSSALAQSVGIKGYHADVFEDGPYPVE